MRPHDYSRQYARFHPDTPEHDASLRAVLRRWLEPHLPADRAGAVLDVGCGRGYALLLLQELGYTNVAGIDPSPGQVEFARARGLDIVQVADSDQFLRDRPARYAVVLLMDVLEHVEVGRQGELLGAIHGCLQPGGRLICTVPNAASPAAAYYRYVDHTHRATFTVESLEFALEQAGFAIEAVTAAEFFHRPRWLFWLPSRRALQWWLLQLHRLRWRWVYMAELGAGRGRTLPLSPNLLARARKD